MAFVSQREDKLQLVAFLYFKKYLEAIIILKSKFLIQNPTFIKELLAYGIGNLIAGIFKGFPACVGLSRCVILDGDEQTLLQVFEFKTLIHFNIFFSHLKA